MPATEKQQSPSPTVLPGAVEHQPPRARPTRRMIVVASLRALASVVVMVTLYYVLPLRGAHDVSSALKLAIGLLAFVVLAVWQVRSMLGATYPVIRAVEVLANLVPLFVLLFAAGYYTMSAGNASNFSSKLTRTDALYFAVTVFATVGFGDIVARTETARVAVTLQMVGDLVVIGVLIRAVVTAAGRLQQQAATGASPDTGDATHGHPGHDERHITPERGG